MSDQMVSILATQSYPRFLLHRIPDIPGARSQCQGWGTFWANVEGFTPPQPRSW